MEQEGPIKKWFMSNRVCVCVCSAQAGSFYPILCPYIFHMHTTTKNTRSIGQDAVFELPVIHIIFRLLALSGIVFCVFYVIALGNRMSTHYGGNKFRKLKLSIGRRPREKKVQWKSICFSFFFFLLFCASCEMSWRFPDVIFSWCCKVDAMIRYGEKNVCVAEVPFNDIMQSNFYILVYVQAI